MLQMTYAYSSNGKCLLSFVVFFPYTVKLTFVLDHASLLFSFCYPRNNFCSMKKFPRVWHWINKRTVNKKK